VLIKPLKGNGVPALQKPVACPGLVSSRSPGRLKLKELRKPGNVFNEFPILATAAHKEILILLLSRGRGKIADVARHVTTFNPAKPKAGVSGDPHDIRKKQHLPRSRPEPRFPDEDENSCYLSACGYAPTSTPANQHRVCQGPRVCKTNPKGHHFRARGLQSVL